LFIEGIPFVVAAKPKVIIETAFSANYSTLWTCGDYKLNLNQLKTDGPVASFFKATKSLLPIGGVSIGVNAVVVAAELKFHLGMGLKTAYAGPFVTFGAAVGATRGSDIGIVNCQSADLVVTGKAGVGLSIDSNIGKFLNSSLASFLGSPRAKYAAGYGKLLGLSQKLGKNNALDFDTALYAKNLYGPVHKTITANVPLCTG
jgi:hypothetical protein